MRFQTWNEAHDHAQARANAEQHSFGIEKLKSPLEPGRDWLVRGIPAKPYRYGCDYTCEAVEPEFTR
ncbi:MAG: hypothetical protein ACREBG_15775 [Pyrinomonadaceae bacterium]